MRYFIQVNPVTKIITDAIDYPYPGYIEINVAGPLPVGVTGGWFKYEGGQVVEHPELKPSDPVSELDNLKKTVARLEAMNKESNENFLSLIDVLVEMEVI